LVSALENSENGDVNFCAIKSITNEKSPIPRNVIIIVGKVTFVDSIESRESEHLPEK